MNLTVFQSGNKPEVSIPKSLLHLSGLSDEPALEFRALPGVLVTIPARMTAMEVVRAVEAFEDLAVYFSAKLAVACGQCEDCGSCDDPLPEPVSVPQYVLEEAGLPPDCKLTACVEDDGTIIVEQADYDHDIMDVPERLLDTFRKAGVCMTGLDDLLVLEEIIHDATEKEEEYLC